MNKDFTLHTEALELKELGFDEPCLKFYTEGILWLDSHLWDIKKDVLAPTYAQAFRWFREKHNYHVIIDFNQSKNNKWYYGIIQIDHNISITPDVEFETYEEAELAALKELIKTIKDRT
jgi:hypothetical protein